MEHPAFPAPSEFQKAGRSWHTSRDAAARSRSRVCAALFENLNQRKFVYERATGKLSSLRKQGPITTAVSCYESR
jgi:hypothetical protein